MVIETDGILIWAIPSIIWGIANLLIRRTAGTHEVLWSDQGQLLWTGRFHSSVSRAVCVLTALCVSHRLPWLRGSECHGPSDSQTSQTPVKNQRWDPASDLKAQPNGRKVIQSRQWNAFLMQFKIPVCFRLQWSINVKRIMWSFCFRAHAGCCCLRLAAVFSYPAETREASGT